MNMPLKVTALVFAMLTNVSCFGMMTLFDKKDNPQLWLDDHLSGICRRITQKISLFQKDNGFERFSILSNDCLDKIWSDITDISSKLNMRATSRFWRGKVILDDAIIEKLEAYRNYPMALKGERKFYPTVESVIFGKYLNGHSAKECADTLGWQYPAGSFDSDGALARGTDHDIIIAPALFAQAYDHVRNNHKESFYKDNQALKNILFLAHKLADYRGLRDIVLYNVHNNKYGQEFFGTEIVRHAICNEDWDFVRALLKTNPHGFCATHDSMLSRCVETSYNCVSKSHQLPDQGTRKEIVHLSRSQSRYPEKRHDHCAIL
jgi:hypothetical protein